MRVLLGRGDWQWFGDLLMAKMSDSELASLVDGMIASAETDSAQKYRTRALQY